MKSLQEKNIFFICRIQYRSFARLVRKVRGEDFAYAESYAARDHLCRLLAKECFEMAERFKTADEKLSLQYIKLATKLLGLSLRPKKLSDLEEIKRALAKLRDTKDPAKGRAREGFVG